MKKHRILAALLAITLAAGAAPALPEITTETMLTVYADDWGYEDDRLLDGDFYYEVMDDGNVMITDYNQPKSDEEDPPLLDVVIPSEIDGRTVTVIGNSAFAYYNRIGSVTIPDTIRKINAFAFDSAKFTTVTIPDSVEHIGYGAFQNCEELTEITLSENVDTLAYWLFWGCKKLEKINGLDHVTKFMGFCLYDTPLLASLQAENPMVILNNVLIDASTCKGDVVIPDGVTTIVSNAFYVEGHYEQHTSDGNGVYGGWSEWVKGESEVTSLYIPASVTKLEPSCLPKYNMPNLAAVNVAEDNPRFSSVDGILYSNNGTVLELCPAAKTEAVIPEGVTEIGTGLSGSEALTSVTLPESLTEISESMLSNCPNLAKVNIPSHVTRIEEGAFYGTGIESITIPDSVTYVHSSAFWETPLYESLGDGVKYVDNWAIELGEGEAVLKDGTVGIADNTLGIATEDNYDYEYWEVTRQNCTSLTVPDSVKYIYPVFENLEELTIPEDLLEKYAFNFIQTPWSEENQETVTLDNGLEIRADIVVDGYFCSGDLVIPDGVTRIAPWAFAFNFSKHADTLYEQHPELFEEDAVFPNGAAITSIYLPDSMKILDNEIFAGCYDLKTIRLPAEAEYMGEIFGNVYDTGMYAGGASFEGFGNLVLPDTLSQDSYILLDTHADCVTVPGSMQTWPGGYVSGGGYVFENLSADYFIFSEGVQDLGGISVNCNKAAFLPKSLGAIRQGAFCMSDLTDIYYAGTEEEWDQIVIDASGYWFVHNANLYDANMHFNATPEDVLRLAAGGTPETTDPTPGGDEPFYGDVDESGKVDLLDVVALNKHLMIGTEISEQGKINADVDLDDKLSPTDSLNILKYVVKLTELPV